MANENARKILLSDIYDLPGVTLPERSDKSYGGLVSSIQAAGLKEPVVLRLREDGKYQLLHGYRRKRACELAKQKEIAAEVYDMTEEEARSYRQKVQTVPTAPVPGKQLSEQQEKELLEKRAKEKAAPAAGSTAKTDGTPKSATPNGQEKDEKPKSATPEKATDPKTAPATGEKKPETPEKPADPKATPASGDKEPKAPEKPADPKTAPASGDKEPKAPEKPADPKAVPAAKTGGTPKSATPDKSADPKVIPINAAKGPGTPEKAAEPAGTGITQVIDARDKAPTEQDLKSLPSPKEGESIFAILHPDYLEKSALNIFSVDRNSENYRELYKSIQNMGIKDPVLARPGKNGKLEIISGQRRHDIAKALGCPVPTFIQQISDEDAKILVADGNLHRDKISSYDLSRALRMKMDAMRQKAGRRKKGQGGPSKYTDEILAEEMGISASKFNRILRLSEATREVCELYDSGKVELSIVSNLAALKPENQKNAIDLYNGGYAMSTAATERMKKAEKNGDLSFTTMKGILTGTYEFPEEKKAREAREKQEAARAKEEKSKQELPPSPDVPASTSTAAPAAPAENGAPSTPTASGGTAPAPAPATEDDIFKGEQERPEVLKVILAGDRLRKYYPDVSMTPREIEEDIYGKLERCRQIDERQRAKDEIFKKGGPTR